MSHWNVPVVSIERRIWLSGQFGSPLSKLHLSERNSMWGQGLTVDCSMDFVNLSSFFEARNATFLSVAEEIHPSVALGKFIPVETYIWKFIHLVRHLTGWLPYRTDFDRCQGSSSVNFPPEISGCCSDSERLVTISVHNSRHCNHSWLHIPSDTMGIWTHVARHVSA